MSGLIIYLLLSTVIVAVHSQRMEAEQCWNRTVHTDDVLVVCRLEEDISKTRHGIAIVPNNIHSGDFFVCGWNGERCPQCYTDHGVQPMGDLTDVLIVKVPADKWQKGDSYKYQLAPSPDGKDPYTPCHVIQINAPSQDGTFGPIQVSGEVATMSRITTNDQYSSMQENDDDSDVIQPSASAVSERGNDQCSGNASGTLVLLAIAIALLLLILAFIIFISIMAYLEWKRYMLNKAGGKSSRRMENGCFHSPLVPAKPVCEEEARNGFL